MSILIIDPHIYVRRRMNQSIIEISKINIFIFSALEIRTTVAINMS